MVVLENVHTMTLKGIVKWMIRSLCIWNSKPVGNMESVCVCVLGCVCVCVGGCADIFSLITGGGQR